MPSTKLVFMEVISPYASHDTATDNDIKGAVSREAPLPLLASWGAPKEMVYITDTVTVHIFLFKMH